MQRKMPFETSITAPIRRTIPREYEYETRCNWPCPCGGTVPDVPESCQWRKKSVQANTFCTEAAICFTVCKVPDCNAYYKFRKKIKERKIIDAQAFECKSRKKEDK